MGGSFLISSNSQVIRKPVDIAKIQQRIDDEKYEDMDALERVYHLIRDKCRLIVPFLQDFMILCKNTQHYNEDGSLIFEDSIVLQSVFTNARERLEQVSVGGFYLFSSYTFNYQEPDDPDEDESNPVDMDDDDSRMSTGSSKKKKESSKSSKKKKKQPVYDSDDDDDD